MIKETVDKAAKKDNSNLTLDEKFLKKINSRDLGELK